MMEFEEDQPSDFGRESGARPEDGASSSRRDDTHLIVPVVLSGGGGTRLWPCSTAEAPKQFLNLMNEHSLFEETLSRVNDRQRFAAPIVVSGANHADICERQLENEGGDARLVLEPCARNTAAAIALAAHAVRGARGDDALMLVMPSDHVIDSLGEFEQAIAIGRQAALDGRLVTFGVRPTGPETGYGYIEIGAEIPSAIGAHNVTRFVEKPELDVAKAMVADGVHLWNAGIFLFKAGVILSEIERFAPDIAHSVTKSFAEADRDGIRVTAQRNAFEQCPSNSIDYAVMEKSDRVAVVPMSPGWSDLGSWDAVAAMLGSENASPLVTTVDCNDCYIRTDGLQIAALGVKDLIIVASQGRLLVMPKGRSQEVKKLLSAMDSAAA